MGKPAGKRPKSRLYMTTILKGIFNKYDGGVGWLHLAQDRDKRRTLVNAVMNPQVP